MTPHFGLIEAAALAVRSLAFRSLINRSLVTAEISVLNTWLQRKTAVIQRNVGHVVRRIVEERFADCLVRKGDLEDVPNTADHVRGLVGRERSVIMLVSSKV